MKALPLSFQSAKELSSHTKSLPSGPHWNFQIISTGTHSIKQPIHLYFHDALDCMEALSNNPLFGEEVDLLPFQLFTTTEQIMQVYTEGMSSDGVWAFFIG